MSPGALAFDAAVVDVDGTLVDTNYHHTLAWSRAFARYDLFPPVWRVHRTIGMGGDRLVAAVAGENAERRCGDAVRDAWVEEFDPMIGEVRVLPGAQDFLRFLRDKSLRVVLATSGKPEHVEHYLDLLDGRELADSWVTAEDAERSKPAPDLVRTAIERAEALSALMVGDSTWDVHAANELDVPTACVCTGGFGEAELRDAGAIAVVEDLPALQRQWDRISAR